MTEIEQKALALLNEVRKEQGYPPAKWDSLDVEWLTIEAIGRAIKRGNEWRQACFDHLIDRAELMCWRQNAVLRDPKTGQYVKKSEHPRLQQGENK